MATTMGPQNVLHAALRTIPELRVLGECDRGEGVGGEVHDKNG